MDDRFSIARVGRDIVGMLRSQWAGVLLVVVVFGIGVGISQQQAFTATTEALSAVDLPGLQPALSGLGQVALNALFAGAMLRAVLIGVEWHDRRGPLAPFRTMLVCFPGVFLAYLLIGLPRIVSTAVFSALMASGSSEPSTDLAVKASLVGIAVSVITLVIFTFLGAAPAAAVAEGLKPAAALLRGAWLTRKRSLLLFALYLAVVMVAGILGAGFVLFSVTNPQATVAGASRRPLVMLALSLLLQTLQVVGAAAVYRELRRLNDPAAQIDETVEVFS